MKRSIPAAGKETGNVGPDRVRLLVVGGWHMDATI